MRNRIDIDDTHSWAICQEIGERLRVHLREQPEPSASLRRQIDRLRELDGQSPSIIPAEEHWFENTRLNGADRGDRSQPIWQWRRKS